MLTAGLLNHLPHLYLIGLVLYMSLSFRSAIERRPELRDEYLVDAERRQRLFLGATIFGVILSVGSRARPDPPAFADGTFPVALFLCWLINRWFIGGLKMKR